MNVLTLLFVITPGFLADVIRRAVFGERKTSDFERTIHSLVLSTVGLAGYLTLGKLAEILGAASDSWLVAPPYLGPILDTSNRTPIVLDWRAFFALLVHTALATLGAYGAVWIMRGPVRSHLGKKGRSLDSSWFLFWGLWKVPDHKPERWVTVVAGGRRVLGQMLSASDPAESKDIVLSDPYFWDEERRLWHADGVRVVYVPEAKVEAIYLSPTDGETPQRGYFDETFTPIPREICNGPRQSAK